MKNIKSYELFQTNYQQEEIKLSPITTEDIKFLYNHLSNIFDRTGWSNQEVWNQISHYDKNLSVVAKINNQIAGFYFIGDDNIPEGGKDYNILKKLKGVEGIALGILKEFKNKGVGKKLIEYPKTIPNINYIWGFQLKSLKNIEHWKKRRKIYYENEYLYITYQIF